MVKLLINGFNGQMGRAITALARSLPDAYQVVAGVDRESGEWEGIPVYANIHAVDQPVDVVVDFSVPAALPATLTYCQNHGAGAVIGTTGLTDADMKLIQHAAARVPIFQSGNMSLGVNLQIELIRQAASTLGEQFDVEIIEQHHNRKVDSPSGTALMLADALSAEYATPRKYEFGRHYANQRRAANEIGIHSIRGGTLVGEHAVHFIGKDEVVEIKHTAYSKQIFAVGALRAADYLMRQKPGVYSMHDIVTEHDVLSHVYTEADQAVITICNLPHVATCLSDIFDAVAAKGVFVDMISFTVPNGTSETVSFSLPQSQLSSAMNALKSVRKRYPDLDVQTVDQLIKLTVEGEGMAFRHGVAAQVFAVLAQANIPLELVTTSETKIAFCVNENDLTAAIAAITRYFAL